MWNEELQNQLDLTQGELRSKTALWSTEEEKWQKERQRLAEENKSLAETKVKLQNKLHLIHKEMREKETIMSNKEQTAMKQRNHVQHLEAAKEALVKRNEQLQKQLDVYYGSFWATENLSRI